MVIKLKNIYLFIFVCLIMLLSAFVQINAVQTFSDKKSEHIELPVIMYHKVSEDKSLTDKYCVSVSTIENDFKYIKQHGYSAVLMKDLINYVKADGVLPEKPILITFDDGFLSVYEYVLPLLKKYDLRAVISIIGSCTDKFTETVDKNLRYAYLDWETVNKLVKSPYTEIQNHSYDLHKIDENRKGIRINNGESVDDYKKALYNDIILCRNKIKNHTGYITTTMTYPYGFYTKESTKLLKEFGFSAALTCEERINTLYRYDADCLYTIGRFNRPENITTEKFFENFSK